MREQRPPHAPRDGSGRVQHRQGKGRQILSPGRDDRLRLPLRHTRRELRQERAGRCGRGRQPPRHLLQDPHGGDRGGRPPHRRFRLRPRREDGRGRTEAPGQEEGLRQGGGAAQGARAPQEAQAVHPHRVHQSGQGRPHVQEEARGAVRHAPTGRGTSGTACPSTAT